MVQMGRVTAAPRFNPVRRIRVNQPAAPQGSATAGINAFMQGVQSGQMLGSWIKDIARDRFGIDMRSPAEIRQANRIQEIMGKEAPSLPELVELRSLSPESFEIYSDGVNRHLKTREGEMALREQMGKLSAQEREKEMDAQIFELSGKLFKPDGSLDMDTAQMMRVLSPKDLQEHLKVGRYMQKMSAPRREVASTVNDMMAGVLNKLRHTPEEGRAAAWRVAKRQLAMQMKGMKGEGGKDNPVNGVLDWAVKDLEKMFQDSETGLMNFTNEGLENVMMGMAQFQDQVGMYAKGKTLKQADEIATGNMSIAKMRRYVEVANAQGATSPIIDTMRARLAIHDAQRAAQAPQPRPPRARQAGQQAGRQQARQVAMQGRGVALDLFGGQRAQAPQPQQRPAPNPQPRQAPQPQRREAPAPPMRPGPGVMGQEGFEPPMRPGPGVMGGQQGTAPPAFLALEAAEQGGLGYDPTDAPRDPGNREPGVVYRLPNGSPALWDGEKWAVMDRGGGNPPSTEPPPADAPAAEETNKMAAQKAKAARASLSVPRNGYSGGRLRRAVEKAVEQYGGDPIAWRRVLSGKASQTVRHIAQQGEVIDLGSFG